MNRSTRLISSLDSPESLCFLLTATLLRNPNPLKFAPTALDSISCRRFTRKWFPRLAFSAAAGNRRCEGEPVLATIHTREEFSHVGRCDRDDEAMKESVAKGEEEDGKDGYRKVELPEELSRNVLVLTCESTAAGGTCDVYVIGTAHVSQDSGREVQALVSLVKPEVVFLELCPSRVGVLTHWNLEVPTMGQMVDKLKKKHNIFGILYSWFLAKVASKLEVFPGSEFRVAFEEAKKYSSKVVLGDRPIEITLKRTWAKMPLRHKVSLLYSMLFQAVFLPSPQQLHRMLKKMNDVDMLTLMIQEVGKKFPTLMETVVHERDQYMSTKLLKVASEHRLVVAVVGKGHLQGIKNNWKKPVKLGDLMAIPPQKPAFSTKKILASLGLVTAGAAIISGIYIASKR